MGKMLNMQQLFSSLKLRIISIHNWYCSKNKASRYAILAVVLLGLWMLSGAVFSDRGDKKAAVPHPAYSIEHSTAQEKHSVVKVSGIAGAKDAVSLMAQDSGIVSEILVQDGQFVKEGTLLMTIDSKNYAELLEKANAAYKAAEIDYRASEILFKKKLLSEANLVKSQADLHSAKATLVKAELDLKNSSVVAPFDGYVDYISAHVGDYISGPASINTPVVGSFFAGKSNIVKVEFSEYDRKQINLNDEALVYFDNIKLNGNVTLLSSVKDTSNNSFRAEITIDGSIPKNINGQDVDVVILGSTVEAHKIPQSALSLDIDGKIGVKIVDSNKIVQFCEITLLDEEDDGVWIRGLPKEADIIMLGHAYIKPLTKLDWKN